MKRMSGTSLIHIPLMGGLGNQLFQFSIGLYLNKVWNFKPLFSLAGLQVKTNTTRNYMLHDLLDEGSLSSLKRLHFALIRLIAVFVPSVFVIENGPSDTPVTRITPNTKLLVGYFQRHTYVDLVKTELLSALSSSSIFSKVIPSESKDEIAVHIRYGDYLQDPATKQAHGLSSMSYYVQAINVLRSKSSYKRIVIYSDEPEKALTDFVSEFGENDLDVLAFSGSNEYEDLRGIAASAGIVISNSSFSWWAAWIGQNTIGSSVIAPKPWFSTPSDADTNLICEGWMVLERSIQ
jgi:hypothetical protein